MFRIIQDTFLIGWIAPKHNTPVAPLGLCRKTQLKHDTNGTWVKTEGLYLSLQF